VCVVFGLGLAHDISAWGPKTLTTMQECRGRKKKNPTWQVNVKANKGIPRRAPLQPKV
jgi:hypothetical protein